MANDQHPVPPSPAFEGTPLSRAEYIAAMVHFYRGEIYRATQWRLRLDNTTNWAILSCTGLATFTLGDRAHSHAAILLGMGLLHTFMVIEARRFRFFDVWQQRVRLIETNFYGPLVRRDLQSPTADWGQQIADDLLRPTFKMSTRQAVRARLTRNYGALFALLMATWLCKLALHPGALADQPLYARMAVGDLPWWVPAALVTGQWLYLGGLWLGVRGIAPAEADYRERPDLGTL
ncbi:MAG: DUF2270 domain-containing protein [Deltaproteobacteria bacterium]|nr:DUF2270 domain-containing protein [Deltaproteobacteria bacterium]